ncbi:outer membrane homotrimeric porin [Desulfovibrio sp. ZJ369]|uniref:outer membrane homotrimeric porin n=1 Tax=Desulfovibrio sp. ZJ369 TaxID=2709793 RepID=UPI0013E9D659|nr:outer membrane homotrimeric porin [Desulfovibrio sp. ZJ369]
MESKERKTLVRLKKQCMVALLAAGMLLGAAHGAKAIDFKVAGEWLVGFGVGDSSLVDKVRDDSGKHKDDTDDLFAAGQRVRLQLDAVASESLSGTVFFEIGDQTWGKADDGGALGADGNSIIKVKNAYIDWAVPQTDLKLRMGLQAVAMPNVAGGSAVMDGDVAAVVANYQFNENVSLTALWMRPVNDNYEGRFSTDEVRQAHYLDNIDLFALSLPMNFDGFSITPWVMYGMQGKNALDGYHSPWNNNPDEAGWGTADGALNYTLNGLYPGFAAEGLSKTGKAYGSMLWAGLPIAITALDPWNFELDLNYGYVEAMGRFDVLKRLNPNDVRRGSSERQGWLAKALVEYKMDWGTPGLFGWYGSGDDGNVKNGSERMPSVAASGNFTSFMGDGNLAWGPNGDWYDRDLSYTGTWGIGLQVKDMSFLEDLTHTFRVAYWGGTNAPSMVKYMDSATAWSDSYGTNDGPYMTTNDGLLEFNLVNAWQIYENLQANLELGYIVNMMDDDTWKKSWMADSYQKQDAWKAQLVFAYSF